mmetsp:Transcript_6997/g.26134  ORF Transcript_6997/g.26134 Transcript_6997/m.26134 type:complete len:91 (+) Transcript_6997:19-291(+)
MSFSHQRQMNHASCTHLCIPSERQQEIANYPQDPHGHFGTDLHHSVAGKQHPLADVGNGGHHCFKKFQSTRHSCFSSMIFQAYSLKQNQC